jgi:hypothetical protein
MPPRGWRRRPPPHAALVWLSTARHHRRQRDGRDLQQHALVRPVLSQHVQRLLRHLAHGNALALRERDDGVELALAVAEHVQRRDAATRRVLQREPARVVAVQQLHRGLPLACTTASHALLAGVGVPPGHDFGTCDRRPK